MKGQRKLYKYGSMQVFKKLIRALKVNLETFTVNYISIRLMSPGNVLVLLWNSFE